QFSETLKFFFETSYVSNYSFADAGPRVLSITLPATQPSNPLNERLRLQLPAAFPQPRWTNSITRTATLGALLKMPYDWSGEFDYTWSSNSTNSLRRNVDTNFLNGITVTPFDYFTDWLAHPPANLATYFYPQFSGTKTENNDLALRGSGP